nr:MAG TPA: hypothetical protein [Caudoviricetes sp.]
MFSYLKIQYIAEKFICFLIYQVSKLVRNKGVWHE